MNGEQIKPGYKRSEVGVIPVEWEVKAFGDCLVGRPRYGINAPAVPFSDRLPAYIRITDITEDGRFGAAHPVSVDSALAVDYYLNDGDLVFARTGASVGKSYRYVPDDGPLVFAGFLIQTRPNPEVLSAAYAAAYVTTGAYWNWVRLMSMRSGQPGINGNEFAKLPVPIPSVAEQHAIADALSDVDALLAKLDQLIAKKRDLKQATMQQLLTGQIRLPGFSEEWDRAELKLLVSTPITDGPHMTPKFYDAGVPFLSVNNLLDNRIDLKDVRYISKEDDLAFARKCKPKVGDVLLGKAASVGKVAIVEEDFDFNIWSPIALVRAGKAIDAKFLYYQLLSTDCIDQIALLTNSSSQGNIGMGDIEKLQISYPEKGEQIAIAAVLSDMDSELASLEARRDKVRALKQGMMQELLTGRIRLI